MDSTEPGDVAGGLGSGFRIRPFKLSDEAAIIHLWQACDLAVPQNDPRRDIARKVRVNPEMFLVGLRSGALVGTCMAGYEGHRGWINYLAVAPDCRRSGLGTELMDEAARLLRKAGCPKINLQVRSNNDEVIAFYRNLGYKADEVVSLGLRLESDES
jgi:ribosomal protein S18 acetylase RimI-like enzyme